MTLIEWPERAVTRLPDRYLLVRLEPVGESKRRLVIEAMPPGNDQTAVLAELRRELAGVS